MESVGSADVVVGIATYNNAATIGHVMTAVSAGLAKYFPQHRCVIINSDGGSKDGTPDVVRNVTIDHRTVLVEHPLAPIHRISTPYHGIPGKGSALRTIFEAAVRLGAKACCVVDADLRSITPEWIQLLVVPVLHRGFDFVAPLYSRHKYDGSITNSVIYPVTRALFGRKIRQPIGGEFGFSGSLAGHYVKQDVWHTDVARFGIDIWMTIEAVACGFNVCQSYLGAKIHNPKDPGSDLRDMFVQVLGSLLGLIEKHHARWKDVREVADVPVFGFKYFVALEPVRVNIGNMIGQFRLGVENLGELWASVLDEETMEELEEASRAADDTFRINDSLWVKIIYDYILAYHRRTIRARHLLSSLIPLYLGRTASFCLEAAQLNNEEAEELVERLCLEYERRRTRLIEGWEGR
ncbi:MAG TPA: glycosyl transferase family 2 [Deltaproteobacteria bacterium]|nr:glycosyl transferase family 2 [Deltaproteobacteria bacterium]